MIERREKETGHANITGEACPFCGEELDEQQGPAKHIRYECSEVPGDD